MPAPRFKNRVGMTVSGAPGTGTITLGSAILDATNGDYVSFSAAYAADANVDVLYIDGHNTSIERDVTYNHAGGTLIRGTVEATWNGSTLSTSALSLTSAAKVFVVASADRLDRQVARPCVAVYAGGGSTQTFSTNWTATKISSPFGNAAAIDSLGGWSVANKRYTPTIAGQYLFIANCKCALNSQELAGLSIYKNGGQLSSMALTHQVRGNGSNVNGTVACIAQMNGSTDYVELYVLQSAASGASVPSDLDTSLSGIYLGPI